MSFFRKLFDPGLRNGLSIGELLETMDAYATAIGQSPMVLHESVSQIIHIDLHIFEPVPGVPHRQIITTGASMYAMPTEPSQSPYAEYMTLLPEDWPTDVEAFDDEKVWWPYRVLKQTAQIPVVNKWSLSEFTSFPFGPPNPVKPGTQFVAAMLVRPYFLPLDRRAMRTPAGKTVDLFCVMPLYESEVNFKLNYEEKDALWKVAMDRGRDPLELCVVNRDREPIA